MNRINFLVLLISIGVLYSCIYSSKNVVVDLTPEFTLDQLNDSSFLADVRSIQFNKYMHITDYERDQLLVLDLEGRIIRSLGMKGKGPGEFLGASHLFLANDSIFIYNDGRRCFEIFNIDKHLKTIHLPFNIELSSSFRFFYKDNKLFFSSIIDNSSLVSLDIKSGITKRFGKIDQFENAKQTQIRNNKHLFPDKTFLLAVSDNLPIIEKYDYNGSLLEIFDYSDHPIIKNRINTINSLKKDLNGYDCLLQDAFYFENKLYLLVYSNLESKITCNNVLIIENANNNMQINSTYHLASLWYQSICISEGVLFAFGQAGLEIFKI